MNTTTIESPPQLVWRKKWSEPKRSLVINLDPSPQRSARGRSGMSGQVHVVPFLSDNYAYIVVDKATNHVRDYGVHVYAELTHAHTTTHNHPQPRTHTFARAHTHLAFRACARSIPCSLPLSVRHTKRVDPGADEGRSRGRCGPIPGQMWADPGADVGRGPLPALIPIPRELVRGSMARSTVLRVP
jgi:hypothetical protein